MLNFERMGRGKNLKKVVRSGSIPFNNCKVSTCHTERRKTKGEERWLQGEHKEWSLRNLVPRRRKSGKSEVWWKDARCIFLRCCLEMPACLWWYAMIGGAIVGIGRCVKNCTGAHFALLRGGEGGGRVVLLQFNKADGLLKGQYRLRCFFEHHILSKDLNFFCLGRKLVDIGSNISKM